ncbi:hypothetical protein BH09PLA1_BH09PLA1_30720 [soil metagenome]
MNWMKRTLHNFKALRRRYAGMALMLVLSAIALATILGASILATSSTQTQVNANILSAARAEYLAESGVQLAIYYLQNPQYAPVLNNTGNYPGQSGISFGADVPGTVDVTVTTAGELTYDINATAHAGANPAAQATRSIKARVLVNVKFIQRHAASFLGDFTVPVGMTIAGDVRCDGMLREDSAGSITGTAYANGSNLATWQSPPSFPAKAAPALNEIEIYNTLGASTPYYRYFDGTSYQTGYAEELPAVAAGEFLPGPQNPKNVWYANGDVSLGAFILNGTLVLRGAGKNLIVNDVAHIAPDKNMPALVVAGAIQFASNADDKALNVDGLCWVGGGISTTGSSSTNCAMNIIGALLQGPDAHDVSANITPKPGVGLKIQFLAKKVAAPNFSNVGATPQSVAILRWGI